MSITLTAKFQRELNRLYDADRNTRKRGLSKLLEELPWTARDKSELNEFILSTLLKALICTCADPVEKCREITLQILSKCMDTLKSLSHDQYAEIIEVLCKRVNTVPYPEEAEELRALVLSLLVKILTLLFNQDKPILSPLVENGTISKIIEVVTKSLMDNFPVNKRSSAELICLLVRANRSAVRRDFKSLLKGALSNVSHQHSKTRSVTLLAIGKLLMCGISDDTYRSVMKESVVNTFLKAVTDRTVAVRSEAAQVLSEVLQYRIQQAQRTRSAYFEADFELFVVLILLRGDESEEVQSVAAVQLSAALSHWDPSIPLHEASAGQADDMDIEDGEVAMRESQEAVVNGSQAVVHDISDREHQFFSKYLLETLEILLAGASGWTTEVKKKYTSGLIRFIEYVNDSINLALPVVLMTLSGLIMDDESEVRVLAQSCSTTLGMFASVQHVLDILTPKILGQTTGGDSPQQRTSAMRLLAFIWRALPRRDEVSATADVFLSACLQVVAATSRPSLFQHREPALREAILLLNRSIIDNFPQYLQQSIDLVKKLCFSLVCLMGRCPGEDALIPDIAKIELRKLAGYYASNHPSTGGTDDICPILLAQLFTYLLGEIVTAERVSPSAGDVVSPADCEAFQWESTSPMKAAFEALLRAAPAGAWTHHKKVIAIITHMVQPKPGPAPDSAAANMLSYQSQRGEEVLPIHAEVDTRLSLLALLEEILRYGTTHWECGASISDAAEVIIKQIIVPNLIWRVGRVEATVRKVALAVAFGILKAGAVKFEILFQVATELVPLLVSNLDDMELTPRLMACLGLTVIFERLKGVFSDQAIREIYPKLLARLDDSSDEVRLAICATLEKFFVCGMSHDCYSSTMVDYSLDQLFIHLDDPNPAIQRAVLQVIVGVAQAVDKALVLKKAEANKECHRTPVLCDKVIIEVQGFEILTDS